MENKKKILVMLTGGTFASIEGEIRRLAKPFQIKEKLSKVSKGSLTDFDVIFPLNTFSENLIVQKWANLLTVFKETDLTCYDGIIMTHGTDTLAYTAAFVSILTEGVNLPIVLVSSNHPLENPLSNGIQNFEAAVKFIELGRYRGTFAAYSYNKHSTCFYAGERLQQSEVFIDRYETFSDRSNIRDNDFGELSNGQFIERDAFLCKQKSVDRQRQPLFKSQNLNKLVGDVLIIFPYVGLNYDFYDLQKVKTVIHSTYHSSTYCMFDEETDQEFINNFSELSILTLKERCEKMGIRLVIAPCKKDTAVYATEDKTLLKIHNISLEAVYAKIILANSLSLENGEWLEFVNNSIAEEFI